jgi:hypothetical protein
LSPGQRGNATVQALAAIALYVGVLASFMPDTQAQPAADALQQVDAETTAQLEADARHRCAMAHGDNGGAIFIDGGVVVCTDKRGRKLSTLRGAP